MNLAFKYIRQLIDKSQRSSGAICIAILLVFIVAGFWPFNFFPKNKVEWLQDQNGVHFYGQGIIVSSDIGRKQEKPIFHNRSITLELRIRPLIETSNAPNILTLYDGKTPDIFAVRQWRNHLVIWSRTDNPAARKRGKPYQEMGLHNALLKNQDVFITITSGAEGSAIYLNGQSARTYPRHHLLAGDMQENVRLILGNSPTGESYWNGNLMGLAVYNRSLTPEQVAGDYQSWLQNDSFSIKQVSGIIGLYPFHERKGEMIRNVANPDETLIIPETFKPVQRKFLSPPWQDFAWNVSFVQDVAINLFGFIPFGFFFSAFLIKTTNLRRGISYFIVAMAGAGLSLSIELIQAWLPTRDSSFTDVISNSVGTILGIVTFQIFRKE
jgi:hypothetical protein